MVRCKCKIVSPSWHQWRRHRCYSVELPMTVRTTTTTLQQPAALRSTTVYLQCRIHGASAPSWGRGRKPCAPLSFSGSPRPASALDLALDLDLPPDLEVDR